MTPHKNGRPQPLQVKRLSHFNVLLSLLFILLILGCSNKPVTQHAPNPEIMRLLQDTEKGKDILIFFDGTANDWVSRTNVRRLFELIAVQEDPRKICLYIDGVGSSSTPLTGGAFGYGMKPRILEGYMFLARYYEPGDRIFIFGFSRGAHQARSLAGMISYNGLPKFTREDTGKPPEKALRSLEEQAQTIWKFSKDQDDISDQEWRAWTSNRQAPFAPDLLEMHQIETVTAEITFLGIWDTVPGSSFKEYDLYGECPDDKAGVRYKIQPYPTIKEIAHALSLDEKRSKFRPVLVRDPIDPQRTQLHQTWFPGAHADVGGGYEDSNDLAGLSMNWILGILGKYNMFEGQQPTVYAAPEGLAHWSMGDRPANYRSEEEDRYVPANSVFHPSIEQRKSETEVPIRREGKIEKEKYEGHNWSSILPECPSVE